MNKNTNLHWTLEIVNDPATGWYGSSPKYILLHKEYIDGKSGGAETVLKGTKLEIEMNLFRIIQKLNGNYFERNRKNSGHYEIYPVEKGFKPLFDLISFTE